MDKLMQDLRHGWKSLMSTPRLTYAALACIALGIGSALFMFTLINAVLLQQPPFPDAERLARIRLFTTEGAGQGDISYLDYRDFREQAKSFDDLQVAIRSRMPITSGQGTERVRGESVTPGYFELIGLRPARGRLFSRDEYAPDANRVILLGDDLWRRKFGGDPEIMGKTLRVRTGQPDEPDRIYTIIGVLPPGFVGTVDSDISEFWIPAEHNPLRQIAFERRQVRNLWSIARLKPGVSFESARAEVEEIGRRIAAANPEVYDDYQFRLEPFGESWRAPLRAGLVMLMVAAALLLLIACTNIANLLLARLAQREHELTLRFVLGAQRGWILRQLLTESLILSVLGGLVGTLLSFWALKLFVASESIRLPSYVEIAPDWRVVALAIGLVLVTGVLFGVLPAWFGARVNASQQLREASRGVSLGRRQRFYGQALVALEVTFTFVLVIGAMLMLRTYLNLTNTDVGFRTQNLLRMAISLDEAEYPDATAQLNFADRARETIRNYPGVRDVTVMSEVLPPWDGASFDMALDGVPNEALRRINRHAIDQNFLRVMEIEPKWGRVFEPTDRQGGPRVALVSQSLARFIAGGEGNGAVGKNFQLVRNAETGELSDPYEIVGVVEDILYHGPRPLMTDLGGNLYEIYVPLAQFPTEVLSFAIHTQGDPNGLNLPLQRELGKLAPTSPMHWISTMEEELANQFLDARFYAYLTTGYSVCALLLAVLGIYGVLANSVTRRFGELGIRMAIGAQGRDIIRLVVGQGMRTLLVGLVIGAVLATLGTKLVVSLLYGVTASDPLTFATVAAILLVLGLVACYLPARRATRIDPVVVLRNE